MKTPKEFYVVTNKDGRLWAGYNSFTTRPWQAKFYSDKRQAEKTAERCKADECRVIKAHITLCFEKEGVDNGND